MELNEHLFRLDPTSRIMSLIGACFSLAVMACVYFSNILLINFLAKATEMCTRFTSSARPSFVNWVPGFSFTKAYDGTINRYCKPHTQVKVRNMHILQCMCLKFCVKFQRCLLNSFVISHTILNQYTAKICSLLGVHFFLRIMISLSYGILGLSETRIQDKWPSRIFPTNLSFLQQQTARLLSNREFFHATDSEIWTGCKIVK